MRLAAKGEIYPPTAYNTVQTAAGKKFGERIETPDTTFPSDRMLQNLVKRIKTPDMIFPSDRMLQNLVKALKHQIRFSLQTECRTGKFSPSMLELWAPAGQLRKRQITEHYTILITVTTAITLQ